MIKFIIIAFSFCLTSFISPLVGRGQDIPPSTEQQLENLTDADQTEPEDDSYLQQLEHFRKNPLDLNNAGMNELTELRILTDLQIINLLSYRRLLGKFVNIYELQAVPTWDIITIRKLLPFVTITPGVSFSNDVEARLKNGDHNFLFRYAQIIEKARGFDETRTGTKYLGDRSRLFFRYRYSYKNLLQYGVVGDKDAGEQFFKGSQDKGFDFYSIHFFARKIGIIQSLALGDFTVNMGQGLIQWQSLAFKKSVDVMGVKRQSATLRPYNSAGEFYFFRGAGITIRKSNFEATAFVSVRKLSANYVTDTISFEDYISSFQPSGYHRTAAEIADKNSVKQTSFGGTIKYLGNRWHIGLNGVRHQFSLPVQKRDEPYNLYAITGNSWSNVSADYSYTYRNVHFFGEAAVDKNFNKAFLHGALLSADSKVDISLVHRLIAKDYQAVNGNAFTENVYPANENGLYTGITIRLTTGWRLDAYADLYRFPWLKYLVDAPSSGKDFLAQLTYMPNKQLEVYSRFRNETRQINQPDNNTAANLLITVPKKNWRTQINYKLNPSFILRSRTELIWYNQKNNTEKGFLTFLDAVYKPMMKPFSGIIRVQYFETDSYNARLYAYENDVLYSYSIPVFYDKGYRYYITFSYDLTKKLSFWFRFGQIIYRDKKAIGTGPDQISGNKKTEIKLQGRLLF